MSEVVNPYSAPDSHSVEIQSPIDIQSYAGFWKRCLAYIIDAIVISGISFVLGLILGLVAVALSSPILVDIGGNLLGLLLGWLYYALLETSSNQGTLGKIALGIKVVDLQGNKLSFGRATGRHFGKILSALILLIGFIMAGFTQKKQGLHDMLAGTLVINK